MVYNLYTVYDRLAKEAGPIFVAVNDQVAERQFRKLIVGSDNPADYQLYNLGEYDSVSLSIKDLDGPSEVFILIKEEK